MPNISTLAAVMKAQACLTQSIPEKKELAHHARLKRNLSSSTPKSAANLSRMKNAQHLREHCNHKFKINTWKSVHRKHIASATVVGSGQEGSLRYIMMHQNLVTWLDWNSSFKIKLQAKDSGFGLILEVLVAGLLATAAGRLNLDLAFFLEGWFMSLSKVKQKCQTQNSKTPDKKYIRFKIPTFKLRDSKFVMPDSQHRTPASIQETLPLTLSSWPWLREKPQKKPTRANNHLPWSYDQLDAWPWSCVIRWELIVWVPDTLPGATGRSFWLNNRQLTLKYESDTVSLWVWLKYESDTVRI